MRVVLLKDFVKKHFPATPVMDYAIEVEKITTSKVTVTPEKGEPCSLKSPAVNTLLLGSQGGVLHSMFSDLNPWGNIFPVP